MSKRLRGKYEPRPRDFYPTPRASVLPFVPHLKAARIRTFCEPCVGEGDLLRVLESFGLRCGYRGDIANGQGMRSTFHVSMIRRSPTRHTLAQYCFP